MEEFVAEFVKGSIYDFKYYNNDELYCHVIAIYVGLRPDQIEYDFKVIDEKYNWNRENIACGINYNKRIYSVGSGVASGYDINYIGDKETNPEYFL